jgi:hypothetical protein
MKSSFVTIAMLKLQHGDAKIVMMVVPICVTIASYNISK